MPNANFPVRTSYPKFYLVFPRWLGDRVTFPLELVKESRWSLYKAQIWMQDVHSAITGPCPISDSGVRYTSEVVVQMPRLQCSLSKVEVAAPFPHFIFFLVNLSIPKFSGEGLNLYHNNDLSHSSDYAKFLTARWPGNSISFLFECQFTVFTPVCCPKQKLISSGFCFVFSI